MFCNSDAICSCSSIGQVRPRIRDRIEDRREKRIWRQACELPPTDRFPSHQASNLHSVQTDTSPLTRPCNCTHRRPDPGRLKTSSRPHECISLALQIKIPCDVHTQPAALKRKSQKYLAIICRVYTCFNLLSSDVKTKQAPLNKDEVYGQTQQSSFVNDRKTSSMTCSIMPQFSHHLEKQ